MQRVFSLLLISVPRFASAGWISEPAISSAKREEESSATAEQAAASGGSDITPLPLVSVPLKKQYVPVSRNGAVVAYKTAYYGDVVVGNPKRTFTVVYDTGSGHLIIPSIGCESESCVKHNRYDRAGSDTSEDIEHTGKLIPPGTTNRDQVTITFGTGKVVGDFVADETCVGESTQFCMKQHIVLGNDMTAEPFGLFDFDGVMGLGLGSLALNPQFSFLEQMAAHHSKLLPQFAVYLARNEEEGRSWMTFGGHDPERAASECEWSPIAMKELGYWQVQLKAVRMGDVVLDTCANGGCRAILDTGSSLLGVPRESVRMMHQHLARPLTGDKAANYGAGVDCRREEGPILTFELEGGGTLTVSHEDYSRPAPVNVTLEEGRPTPFCRAVLLPLDLKEPLGPRTFIWGEPALRKYYQIYDWGSSRVGLALAKRPGRSKAGPTYTSVHSSGSLAKGTPRHDQLNDSPND